RHHRHALDATVVCRRRAPYRGSRGLVWRGHLSGSRGGSRPILSSILPAAAVLPPPLRVLPLPALLLGVNVNPWSNTGRAVRLCSEHLWRDNWVFGFDSLRRQRPPLKELPMVRMKQLLLLMMVVALAGCA